jgi:hypothetical protein
MDHLLDHDAPRVAENQRARHAEGSSGGRVRRQGATEPSSGTFCTVRGRALKGRRPRLRTRLRNAAHCLRGRPESGQAQCAASSLRVGAGWARLRLEAAPSCAICQVLVKRRQRGGPVASSSADPRPLARREASGPCRGPDPFAPFSRVKRRRPIRQAVPEAALVSGRSLCTRRAGSATRRLRAGLMKRCCQSDARSRTSRPARS